MLSLMNRAVGRVRAALALRARGDGGNPFAEGLPRERDTAMGGFTDNISCAAAGFASCMTAIP
jgi:hypothetical protein